MMQDFKKYVGVVNQVKDDCHLYFIVNNNIKCNIADIVGVNSGEDIIVLAKIIDIQVDYYLDNTKLYFISKAVDNDVVKLSNPDNMPRYGQYITAKILGHYLLAPNGIYFEKENSINRYTPYVFQKIFKVPFENSLILYGLIDRKGNTGIDINEESISVGELAFPNVDDEGDNPVSINIDMSIFKKHTLITGVTGSGKSRIAALLIKKLVKKGAHVSILDPHDEYSELLVPSDKYEIFKFRKGNTQDKKYEGKIKFDTLCFYEKNLDANVLTKLLPSLSTQQEDLIYEAFEKFKLEPFNISVFINRLIDLLNIELELDYPMDKIDNFKKIQDSLKDLHGSQTTFIEAYTHRIMPLLKNEKVSKVNVIIAVIQKINELKKNNLVSNILPNWLKVSPFSVDILNIDYSTNETIRRFINSVIQYFLRQENEDKFRVLVIDEAHLLLRENSTTSKLIIQLLREARKFNVSLIFISQNYFDIPEEIISQFQNIFNFKELKNDITKYLQERVTTATLFGAKTNFSFKVDEVLSYKELEEKKSL